MKILHITGEYPPYVLGGLGTYIDEITKRLARKHTIKICVLKGESMVYNRINEVKKKNVDVIQKSFRQDEFAKLAQYIDQPKTIISEFGLNELLSDPPDIIHVHDWYGTLWAACIQSLISIPFVMTSHLPIRAGFTYTSHPISMKLKMQLEALGMRTANRVLAPSRFVADTLMREYNVEENLIDVIPNGVDYSFFSQTTKQNKDIARTHLLSVSRLTEQKGITYLFDVVNNLRKFIPEVKCIIVGSGPIKEQLSFECRRLELQNNVWFTGFLQKEELRKLYQGSTMFISTSIYEPFGLVILEAMASGLPVMSFDMGGIHEIVDSGKDGVLVAPCDVDEMTQSIMKYFHDPDLLRELSVEGKRKAQTYSWDLIVQRLESIYRSLHKSNI